MILHLSNPRTTKILLQPEVVSRKVLLLPSENGQPSFAPTQSCSPEVFSRLQWSLASSSRPQRACSVVPRSGVLFINPWTFPECLSLQVKHLRCFLLCRHPQGSLLLYFPFPLHISRLPFITPFCSPAHCRLDPAL